MQLLVRAVVTGFGMALGGALFRRVAKRIGLDEPDPKQQIVREPVEPIEVGDKPGSGVS